jgi:hypothetical protein
VLLSSLVLVSLGGFVVAYVFNVPFYPINALLVE